MVLIEHLRILCGVTVMGREERRVVLVYPVTSTERGKLKRLHVADVARISGISISSHKSSPPFFVLAGYSDATIQRLVGEK
jgi:hypothetical protein